MCMSPNPLSTALCGWSSVMVKVCWQFDEFGTWLLLTLTANLGIVCVRVDSLAFTVQVLELETSIQISKESPGGQARHPEKGSVWSYTNEIRLQWETQEAGKSKIMEQTLPRKAGPAQKKSHVGYNQQDHRDGVTQFLCNAHLTSLCSGGQIENYRTECLLCLVLVLSHLLEWVCVSRVIESWNYLTCS